MSMTIEEISGMLTRFDIDNEIDKDGDVRVVPIPTQNYINSDGKKILSLYISLRNYEEEGQIFSVHTMRSLFETKGNEHRDLLLKFCTMIQGFPDPVQFIYSTDANIYARIEIPLADNKLTHKQVLLCLHLMCRVIDRTYVLLNQTLETGVLPEQLRQSLAEGEGHPETTRL